MIVLFNPTDEKITVQHAGISRTMEPRTQLEVEDACGKHVLNSHGPRGLSQLTYGCDEEKVRKDGIERNFEFKKKQVVEYNQRNESRKQSGLPYQPATREVKQYAIDLGLVLLEPFAVRDEEREAIADAKKENDDLRSQISSLTEQMAKLAEAMTNKEPQVVYMKQPHKRAPKKKVGVKKDE